jgi:tetratricopeptide (TPR) repeat protein
MYHRYSWVFLFILMWLKAAPAQSQAIVDTLKLVNQLHAHKKIKESEVLLAQYYKNHPHDFNTIWLFAQAEYWLKHFKKARKLYEKGIRLQPGNAYLQLDYSRMLLNTGRYKKAGYWLNKLKQQAVTSSAAKLELAKLFYWRGDNLKAKSEIKEVLREIPDDPTASNLLRDIKISGSPWMQFSTAYQSDTQPLQNISSSFESGVSFNRLFSPYAGVYFPVFIYNGHTVNSKIFVLGNKSMLSSLGTELSYNAGIIKYPYQNSNDWVGRISVNQKISRQLSLTVEKERKPYFNTMASLDTVVSTNRFYSSLNLANEKGFSGKIAFDKNTFDDKNFVYSAYGYLLSPPIKFSNINILLGYSFGYNNSKENKFRPAQSLHEIIASYNQGNPICGYYDPYFTPQQQYIHSAVLSVSIQPRPMVKFGINVSSALMANTVNPYFYLDAKGMGKINLVKDYFQTSFRPIEGSAYIEWKVGKKNMIRAEYAYRNTFFYESNYLALNLLSKFWK